MITNIVMISRGREKLTAQALESIYLNTELSTYTITIVEDGSADYFDMNLATYISVICVRSRILGELRNLGAYWAAKRFRRGDRICFLDNDVAVFPGWLERMIRDSEITSLSSNIAQLHCVGFGTVIGGCQHPFHKTNYRMTNSDRTAVNITDAVAGYSMLMSWATWDVFGPFDSNAPGIGQSEDYAFCQRVKAAGGIVGYSDPPVLSHCGITNSDGKPATGAEDFPRVPGLLYL
jgi:glycosyltransferase involved in cell wall biosynthesis